MERISRYRILQILFVVVFIISVLVIWNIVRTRTSIVPSIQDLFDLEVGAIPTAVVNPTATVVIMPEMAETAEPQNFTYYEVQPGDTLTDIAQEFGVTIGTIQQANGLESDDSIDANDVLAIPADGAFSLVGVAATVEAISATQVAVMGQATAVSATAQANDANISAVATQSSAVAATVEANRVKIEVLADVEETQSSEGVPWVSILTGPILTSILAFGGFLTSTWFEWRDDQREEDSANAIIERKKLEAELRLLELQVKEKEREIVARRRREQGSE
ncbi:MAG: LysM domain-containing protein [Chloroflexota bacterium]